MLFAGAQVDWITNTSHAAHVLADVDRRLTVGEGADLHAPEIEVEMLADRRGKLRTRVPGEDLGDVAGHRLLFSLAGS